MGNRKAKVLVIGFDGADYNLIAKWTRGGRLLNFAKFMEDGVYGKLFSPSCLSPPSWTSITTGVWPNKHGILGFLTRKSDSYDISIVHSRLRKVDPIWILLNRAGKKVGVINVPITYPPDRVNGFMISGLGTPSLKSNFAEPPELRDWLIKQGFKVGMEAYHKFKGREDEFIKELYEVTEKRKEISLDLMCRYEWDFFMVVFTGSDRVQHFFWNYYDDKHPMYNPEKADRYRDVIPRYYEKMDEILGEFLKRIDENTYVFVLSDHGFGKRRYRLIHLNRWFEKNGLLKLRRKGLHQILTKPSIRMKLQNTLRRLPECIRSKMLTSAPAYSLIGADVDWARTKVWSIDDGGKIYINRSGKEPHGCVKREEYENLREYLIKKLYELKDPKTNREVVEHVSEGEEVCQTLRFRIPDLIVEFRDGYKDSITYHGAVFDYENVVTGDHDEDGIFMMLGPLVKKNTEVKGARQIDVMPTILYIMGYPTPEYVDGRSLKEALKLAFRSHGEPERT